MALVKKLKIIQNDDGNSIVEFGISAGLLMLMILGLMDISRALYAYHYVSSVARDATRYAMVRGASWSNTNCVSTLTFNCVASATDITNYVQSVTPIGVNPASLSVNTTWNGKTPAGGACSSAGKNNSPGCMIGVRVSYAFNFVVPIIPSSALVFASTSNVVITQ